MNDPRKVLFNIIKNNDIKKLKSFLNQYEVKNDNYDSFI